MACTRRSLLLVVFSLFVARVQPATLSRSKRALDTGPLEAVVSSNSQHIQQQQAQLTALQDKLSQLEPQLQQTHDKASQKIGFYVRLVNQPIQIKAGDILKFGNVITNVGNGYDRLTGIFIAPASGLYAFAVHAFPGDTTHRGNLRLLINNNGVIFVDSSVPDSGNGVFHMNQGDRAWVAGNHGSPSFYSYETTFTGFLVTPDF